MKLTKVTKSEIRSIKCNNAFKDYKAAFDLAVRLIDRLDVSFELGTESEIKVQTKKVKPFFIRIELLFELYCRVMVEKAILKNNALTLRPYSENETRIFKPGAVGENPMGFQNNNIADIIVETKGDQGQKRYILDAKYRFLEDGYEDMKREITHQILAYMLLYQADYGGFIFSSMNETKIIKKDMEFDPSKFVFSCGLLWPEKDTTHVEKIRSLFDDL